MSDEERRRFLAEGARIGALSTVCPDGRPHGAPIWFTPDGDDLVFTTGRDSTKGRNLRRTGQAALTVDDPEPPYAFVTVSGPVEISEDLDVLLHWATVIAGRYMGAQEAEDFGRRNAVPGELLVRLMPDRVVAQAEIAD